MEEMKDTPLPSDDVRFDRLVDGELSPEEYRALLATLDQEPAGWRSCALAFLESQALAGELGGVRRTLDRPPPVVAKAAVSRSRAALRTLLAMAASFALAFGLGIELPRFWNYLSQEQPLGGNLSMPQETAVDADGTRHETLRPIGNVRLVVNGASGEETSEELPVYEIGQNLEDYLEQSPPGLDPYVLQWLQQQGHQVEVQQQYIPGQLADGRPMYVPVEQYTITPVKRSY